MPLFTVVALVAGLAAAGAFLAAQMFLSPASSRAPAQVGEAVRVPGGLLRVDRVIPEHMDPMHLDKFANSGMKMSAMGMDMAPQGYRRFTVGVSLLGQGSSGLRYSADQFRLAGEGMPETGTLRHQLSQGVLPAGSATSGSLTFQVPEAASGLLLSFRDGERSIALDLGSALDSHDHATDSHDHSDSKDGEDHVD